MDIYVLDQNLVRQGLIERYESMVWTERWRELGDFQLTLPYFLTDKIKLRLEQFLWIPESDRLMMIESIEVVNTGRTKSVTVKGRSSEFILGERLANPLGTTGTPGRTQIVTGQPHSLMNALIRAAVMNGANAVHVHDQVPVITGEGGRVGSIPLPTVTHTLEKKINQTALDHILALASEYNIGFEFRLTIVNGGSNYITFNTYTGNDRRQGNGVNGAVLFDGALGTLTDTRTFMSLIGHKNTMYAYGKNMREIRTSPSYRSSTGWSRRVGVVDVSSEDPGTFTIEEQRILLIAEGIKEMMKKRLIWMVDGAPDQTNDIVVYKKHYHLGDIVQVVDEDRIVTDVRVVEHMFVSDGEGDRSYPAFQIENPWD